MKKFLLLLSGLFLAGGAHILTVNAAPTSTIVQNLRITSLLNAPCLITDGTGLVGSSTSCGSGGSSSSTTVFGSNGVNVSALVNGKQTSTLDTSYAASWSALETFLKGITINGTTTLASTTNVMLWTNGSGVVLGVTIGNGLLFNTTTGALSFVNPGFASSSITISGGGIISGGGDLTANRILSLTTSTLYGLFSGTSPISFNTSTGAISFVNPGYVTSAITSINGDTTAAQKITGSNGITTSTIAGITTIGISTSTWGLGTLSQVNSPVPIANGGTATSATPGTNNLMYFDGTFIRGTSTVFYPNSNPSGFITTAITSINTATSSSQTIVGGTAINVATVNGVGNSTTTVTNTGVTSLSNNSASGGVDFSASTGANITGVLHSLNISQFVNNSGFGSGTVTTSSAVSVNNFPFWATTAGALSGTSTLTNAGGNINASGTISSNGTLVVLQTRNINTTAPLGGGGALSGDLTITCTTCITTASGYSTSTGANPTALVGIAAVNGSNNTFIRSDGAPRLDTTAAFAFTGLASGTVNGLWAVNTLNVSSTAIFLNSITQSGGANQFSSTTFLGNVTGTAANFSGTVTIASNSLVDASGNKYSTSTGAATSINGTASQTFLIQGDGISVTSTVNGSTTIFSTIGADGDANYYFTASSSDISNNLVASDTPYTTLSSTTVASLSNGTTSIQKWATATNVPSLPFIPPGLFDVHIDGAQIAGTKPTFLYATVSDLSSTGVVQGIILTTENGPTLTGATGDYDLLGSLSSPYSMASTTDRIGVNIIASVSGALLAPTVQIYYGGASADSRLELPASTADVTNFIPYVGAVKNVNLGSNGLTVGGATIFTNTLTQSGGVTSLASTTITGQATTTNLSITAVTSTPLGTDSSGNVVSMFPLSSPSQPYLPNGKFVSAVQTLQAGLTNLYTAGATETDLIPAIRFGNYSTSSASVQVGVTISGTFYPIQSTQSLTASIFTNLSQSFVLLPNESLTVSSSVSSAKIGVFPQIIAASSSAKISAVHFTNFAATTTLFTVPSNKTVEVISGNTYTVTTNPSLALYSVTSGSGSTSLFCVPSGQATSTGNQTVNALAVFAATVQASSINLCTTMSSGDYIDIEGQTTAGAGSLAWFNYISS